MRTILLVLGAVTVLAAWTVGLAAANEQHELYNCWNGTTGQNGVSKEDAKDLKARGYVCWGQEERLKYKYACTNGGRPIYTIKEFVKLFEAQGYSCTREDAPFQE